MKCLLYCITIISFISCKSMQQDNSSSLRTLEKTHAEINNLVTKHSQSTSNLYKLYKRIVSYKPDAMIHQNIWLFLQEKIRLLGRRIGADQDLKNLFEQATKSTNNPQVTNNFFSHYVIKVAKEVEEISDIRWNMHVRHKTFESFLEYNKNIAPTDKNLIALFAAHYLVSYVDDLAQFENLSSLFEDKQ